MLNPLPLSCAPPRRIHGQQVFSFEPDLTGSEGEPGGRQTEHRQCGCIDFPETGFPDDCR
jgi:hypothetical protein